MRASAASTSLRLVVLPWARSRASAAMGRTTVSAIFVRASPRGQLAFRAFVVIMHLEEKAACFRFERPVKRPRRAAGVGVGTEAGTAFAVPVVADDQVARDEIHLLPVIVHEGLGGMHARGEPQVTRAEAALGLLVEEPGEHLLLDPLRIAGQLFPALVQVHLVELLVLFPNRHECAPNPRSRGCGLHTRARVCGSLSRRAARSRNARRCLSLTCGPLFSHGEFPFAYHVSSE